MNEVLKLLEKQKGFIWVILVTLVVVGATLTIVKRIADAFTAFETSGVHWSIWAAVLTFSFWVASVSTLTRNRALYTLKQRVASAFILALSSLVELRLLWITASNKFPVLSQWIGIARWVYIAAGVVSLAAIVLYWNSEKKRGERFRILITELSEGAVSEKPQDRTINVLVGNALEEMATTEDGFEVEFFDEVVLDSRKARRFGENAQATVVMFGFYAKSESRVLLNIGFEVLRQPDFYYPLSLKRRTVDIEELKSFRLHTSLAGEALYLTFFLRGLFQYSRKEYSDAVKSFERAVGQSSFEIDRGPDAALHTYLGNTLYYLDEQEKAVKEYHHVTGRAIW